MSASERDKGAAAEREVCELLREWWGRLEPGCEFRRTPKSGGWATPSARREFGTAGDLVTTAKRFPFCVEVKRREAWVLERVLAGKSSPVWGWWRQACTQANESNGKAPLLLFRRNRQPWYVMVRGDGWRWPDRLTDRRLCWVVSRPDLDVGVLVFPWAACELFVKPEEVADPE